MLETVKKICNVSLNKTSKQYENAKKIKHQSHKDLTQNETAKIMSFSPPLSFETAEKILNSPNKCFENVKIIIFSMDFNLLVPPPQFMEILETSIPLIICLKFHQAFSLKSNIAHKKKTQL